MPLRGDGPTLHTKVIRWPGIVLIFGVLSLLLCGCAYAENLGEFVEDCRAGFFYRLSIESAGFFWLAAELVILHLVICAGRFLACRPLPESFRFEGTEWRRAGIGVLVLGMAMLVNYGRHFFIPPIHILVDGFDATSTVSADLISQYASRVYTHMSIWAVFVTGWVMLEILIVYFGYKAFLELKKHLKTSGSGGRRNFAGFRLRNIVAAIIVIVLMVCFARAFLSAADTVLRENARAVTSAEAMIAYVDPLLRNALHLYLRVAGVFWVGAEWVAVIIILRTYSLLRSAVRERRLAR